MTPNFALDLSEDGITLLHRAPNGAGWFREGRVDFAKGNIAEGLAKLRARAVELEGEGFQTKLILPRSQLLFTRVEKGADVGQALSEQTPYRPDQLSFATCEDGDHLKVAAVALETLGEAEGFISPHGLNPVGFTAIPEEHQFDGEPMLGGMLMGPESFETDDQPVRIIEKPTFLPDPVEPVASDTDTVSSEQPAETVNEDTTTEIATSTSAQKEKSEAVAELEVDASAQGEKESKPRSKPKPAPPVAAAPEPRDSQPAAFSSRRNGGEDDGGSETGERVKRRSPRIVTRILDFDTAPKLGAAPAKMGEAPAGETAPEKDPEVPSSEPVLTTAKTNAEKAAAKKTEKTPKKAKPAKAASKSEPLPPKRVVSAPAAPKPVPVVPPSSSITVKDRTQPPAAVAAQMAKVDPLAHLAAKQQRGKPRFLGLILTCILLVCLGLAALLSSFVLPDTAVGRLFGGGNEEQTDIALGTDPALIEGPEADAPLVDETPFELSLDDGILSEETELAALPPQDGIPDFARLNDDDLPPLAVPDESVALRPEVITEDEALAAYAATGIWQYANTLKLSQSAPENLDTLYVASLDPSLAFEDAPALQPPPPGGGEVELAAFTPPPPPGVVFDFDDRGLVRPTPEGAVNPFGIVIFDGAPPVRALPRPGDEPSVVQTEPVEPEAAEPEVAEEIDPETLRLAGIRPAQRPNDLAETQERATLGGLTRAELAAFRPKVRPTSDQQRAEAIARALAEAEAGDETPDLRTATAQAVGQSIRAPGRPSNLASLSARTRPQSPSAGSASTAGIQQASAARAAPTPRGNGPAVARSSRAQPTGPVSSRVARAATDNNAIALGRVALVGVFGTASNRSALVRMPNGRFKKVSVGDRVDGGRVAAISSNSLRYTKSGRTLTLEMPSS